MKQMAQSEDNRLLYNVMFLRHTAIWAWCLERIPAQIRQTLFMIYKL